MVKFIDDWRASRKEKRAQISFARKWPFALLVGLALGVLSLISKGNLTANGGLSSPCRVEVVADVLPIRSDPDPTNSRIYGDLKRGDLRGATTTVRNGYRQLADNTWALDQYLRPLPPVERCKPG